MSGVAEAASRLPERVTAYGRSPEFTQDSVPASLLKAHSTKQGTWGLIRVIEGELLYRVVDKRRRPIELFLRPGVDGVVEPEILHEVEPAGSVRFFVEFFR